MRILGFGTYDQVRHPRVKVILDGLVGLGHEVAEANAPLGFSTAERVEMLQRPWLVYRLAGRLAQSWMTVAGQTRRHRRHGRFDAVLVGYMGHFDVVLARLMFPRTTIVLDMLIFAADTASDRGTRSRAKLAALGLLDFVAVASADVVLVDTEENAALVGRRATAKVLVVPVGATTEWSAAAHPSPADRGGALRVIFFGLFTPLQGAAVVGAALGLLAESAPPIEVTMAGTGQDYRAARDAAAGNDRVKWLDWVPASELPSLVADHDVCLGIFGITGKAQRVVPNKVYQGAAAGCAIVTSDTAPQVRAFADAALFVPPGDPAALAQALRDLAADRQRLQGLRRAAAEQAGSFSPAAVAEILIRRLAGPSG